MSSPFSVILFQSYFSAWYIDTQIIYAGNSSPNHHNPLPPPDGLFTRTRALCRDVVNRLLSINLGVGRRKILIFRFGGYCARRQWPTIDCPPTRRVSRTYTIHRLWPWPQAPACSPPITAHGLTIDLLKHQTIVFFYYKLRTITWTFIYILIYYSI